MHGRVLLVGGMAQGHEGGQPLQPSLPYARKDNEAPGGGKRETSPVRAASWPAVGAAPETDIQTDSEGGSSVARGRVRQANAGSRCAALAGAGVVSAKRRLGLVVVAEHDPSVAHSA